MFQVTASNTKGDMIIELFEDQEEARVLHRKLWNQTGKDGKLLWGMVRTTDISREAA